MTRRTSTTLALAAAAGTLAACGDSPTKGPEARLTAGGGPTGIYVTRSIGGQPLPAVGIDHEGYRLVVETDSLYLHEDGTGMWTFTGQAQEPPGSPATRRGETTGLRYTIAGDVFEAEVPCPDGNDFAPTAACLAPPHLAGRIRNDSLILDTRVAFRAPTVLVRVADASPIATVTVSSPPGSVRLGQSVRLTARAFDATGAERTGLPIRWGSSLPSVARVDADGLVSTVAPGVARISAFIGGRWGRVDLTVVQ